MTGRKERVIIRCAVIGPLHNIGCSADVQVRFAIIPAGRPNLLGGYVYFLKGGKVLGNWKIPVFCALLTFVLSVTAWAADAELMSMTGSGECGADGNTVIWTLDADGVLTISGNGKIADDNSSVENYLPWQNYRRYIVAISISDGITNIPDYAFSRCDYLESVTIGNDVTTIGEAAFVECIRLESVKIGTGVTAILEGAFAGCSQLVSVDFNDKLESIGTDAFISCGLADLHIPDNVKTVKEYAFGENHQLESVVIGSGVSFLAQRMFESCTALNSITIPETVTAIDESCFNGCGNLSDVYYSGTAAQWDKVRGGGADDLLYRAVRIHFNSTGPDDTEPMSFTITVKKNHTENIQFEINAAGNGLQIVSVVRSYYGTNGQFIYSNWYTDYFPQADNVFNAYYWNTDVQAKTVKLIILDEQFRPLCPCAIGTFEW